MFWTKLEAKWVEHYLLDEGNLDEAMIRRWAFDPEAELMQQDEDLLLHDWNFTEILLELAADPACPKAEYILDIWNYFTRNNLVHQVPSDLFVARHALSLAERYSSHSGIRRWVAGQKARLRYVEGVGRVTRATALTMADTLLNGEDRTGEIDVLRESGAYFLMQQSFPNPSYKEWLLIDKQTGAFRYSRYWPKGASEPKWFDPHQQPFNSPSPRT